MNHTISAWACRSSVDFLPLLHRSTGYYWVWGVFTACGYWVHGKVTEATAWKSVSLSVKWCFALQKLIRLLISAWVDCKLKYCKLQTLKNNGNSIEK